MGGVGLRVDPDAVEGDRQSVSANYKLSRKALSKLSGKPETASEMSRLRKGEKLSKTPTHPPYDTLS